MILARQEDCSGCGACYNACPVDAIRMVSDCEGFLQPVIDHAQCIKCGKCKLVCPILNPTKGCPRQIAKEPLCGCTKIDAVWSASTSGGAFTEICRAVADRSPVVFGARFKGLNVVHDCVEGVSNISPLRKSKYVQSDVGLSYRKCREYLDAGRFVVFSAAPCQIAGLRLFLGKDYLNLLTVEFICHGVGSPQFFKSCIEVVQKNVGKKVIGYEFRTKDKGALNLYSSLYRFKDGTHIIMQKDLYCSFFLSQLCLRKSCMQNCRFRTSSRYADITVSDSRAEERLYAKPDGKNWSVVVANTERGRALLKVLSFSMRLKPYPIELLAETNPLYFRTTAGNPKRNECFDLYKDGMPIMAIARRLGVVESTFPIRKIFRKIIRLISRGMLRGRCK